MVIGMESSCNVGVAQLSMHRTKLKLQAPGKYRAKANDAVYVIKTTYSPSFWYPDALMTHADMPFHNLWPRDKVVLACAPAILFLGLRQKEIMFARDYGHFTNICSMFLHVW